MVGDNAARRAMSGYHVGHENVQDLFGGGMLMHWDRPLHVVASQCVSDVNSAVFGVL